MSTHLIPRKECNREAPLFEGRPSTCRSHPHSDDDLWLRSWNSRPWAKWCQFWSSCIRKYQWAVLGSGLVHAWLLPKWEGRTKSFCTSKVPASLSILFFWGSSDISSTYFCGDSGEISNAGIGFEVAENSISELIVRVELRSFMVLNLRVCIYIFCTSSSLLYIIINFFWLIP